MSYSKVVKEYVKVRAEQTENNTMIAREVKAKFNPPQELDKVRRWISLFRKRLKIKAQQQPIKRLFFDIETSYYTCRLWHIGKMDYISPETIITQKQIICIAYKWQYEEDVHILDWEMGEKEMLSEFIKVLAEADELVGHNCVEKNTPVLKADFTWVKAGDLKEGDELLGFDEGLKPGEPLRDINKKWKTKGVRKLQKSIVTGNIIEKQKCIKVTFDNGDEIITTLDHYWLGMTLKDNYHKWLKSEDLKVGYRIIKYMDTYDVNKSYEAGWLSGFISGEGTLKTNNGVPSSIDFCQRPTSTLAQAVNYCKMLNIDMSNLYSKTGGLGRGDTLYTYSTGGKWKTFEHLGKLQIKRFIEKIDYNNLGILSGEFSNKENTGIRTIVKIEDAGIREVAVLSTSSKTYFANGYPMHNCNRFDLKELRTRCIYYGLPMFPTYRTLDTLLKSREYFSFASNKLDYIGKYLQVGKKLDHTGFQLWIDVVEKKDPDALKLMKDYCIQDVVLLEDVYTVLSPYITHNNNFAVLTGGEKWECPECASNDVVLSHTYATAMGTIKRNMKCNCCGKQYKISNKSYMKMLEESMK